MEVADCEALRREIKTIADRMYPIRMQGSDIAEAIANFTLAYRHLEDASLRLGKCIQALDGGVSVYDKTQVPGAGA